MIGTFPGTRLGARTIEQGYGRSLIVSRTEGSVFTVQALSVCTLKNAENLQAV
jgi:hypothetical protein